jgi:hypothetical protein
MRGILTSVRVNRVGLGKCHPLGLPPGSDIPLHRYKLTQRWPSGEGQPAFRDIMNVFTRRS